MVPVGQGLYGEDCRAAGHCVCGLCAAIASPTNRYKNKSTISELPPKPVKAGRPPKEICEHVMVVHNFGTANQFSKCHKCLKVRMF